MPTPEMVTLRTGETVPRGLLFTTQMNIEHLVESAARTGPLNAALIVADLVALACGTINKVPPHFAEQMRRLNLIDSNGGMFTAVAAIVRASFDGDVLHLVRVPAVNAS
jgi:hypothetical protein